MVALVFWKDSLDFNRIIKKQMDYVETKSNAPGATGSPDKTRNTTYRKAAEDAIQQHRAGQSSRSAFGSVSGAYGGQPFGGTNTAGGFR